MAVSLGFLLRMRLVKLKKITQAGVDNSSTKLLSEGTTIISARGTVGKVALCGVPMAMNQSCYAINGKQDDLGFYTYYLTRSISLQLQQGANGSVFDTITRNTFEQLPMVLPPPELIIDFNKFVSPILLKIKDHLLQSNVLAKIRDALLPKLMNGDIPVGAGSKPARSTDIGSFREPS
jgi:type I restriction enzyme, S subunit